MEVKIEGQKGECYYLSYFVQSINFEGMFGEKWCFDQPDEDHTPTSIISIYQ